MTSSTSTRDRSAEVSPHDASKSTACNDDQAGYPARAGGHSSGFILISVIWIALFLAAAVVSFTLTVRSNMQQSRATISRAQSGALADGGIHLALHDMINAQADRRRPRRFPTDGVAGSCSLEGHTLTIAISDEAGKVDLNTAGEALLAALFSGLDLPAEGANQLAAAVLDYRDADNTRRQGGAEVDDYRLAGRSGGPKNAPFDSPLELAQVLGINSALLARIEPFVTVHSGLSGVDPSKAPSRLIDILTAGTNIGGLAAGAQLVPQAGARLPREFVSRSSQQTFAILAQATDGNGGAFARQAIVRLSPAGNPPYRVLGWRQVDASALQPANDLGPC